jgi:RimK family alpha-L-glutamate ligase
LTDDQLALAVAIAHSRARALDRKLRGARLQPSFAGRTALLVDDGLTTGASMIAAARWAAERGGGCRMTTAPATELARAGEIVLLPGSRQISTSLDRRGMGADAAVHVVGSGGNVTSAELVRKWSEHGLDAVVVSAEEALQLLGPGDVAIGRLDVLPTLDGVEPGLLALLWLERRGVRVLNRASALITIHDKLRTARCLEGAGIPHPHTTCVRATRSAPKLQPPVVLKPRFGSWGRDVVLCRDGVELERCIEAVRGRPWFRRHGALLQELVPPRGYDLRLIVAGGEVVGGSERVAAVGDWRTNVSLGGTLRTADVPPAARSLAVAAAAAVGADLVGVDLLPIEDDRYVVLELNGAVDFDERYSLGGGDVFVEAARALSLPITC